MPRIKIYTIQITEPAHWYENRKGEVFTAQLACRETTDRWGNKIIAFKVSNSPFWFVNPIHCKVIDEKTIDIC